MDENEAWSMIVSSTHAYTDELFRPDGMTHVLYHARRDAGISDYGVIGILPSVSANEAHFVSSPLQAANEEQREEGPDDALPPQQYSDLHARTTLARHVSRWLDAAREQGNPPILVGTISFGKTNGHNHYCALWIDVEAGTCEIWDSATSETLAPRSEFSDLFLSAACELVGPVPRGCGWVNSCSNVRHIPAIRYGAIFQRDGGYVQARGSLEYQNIFCHTWTLFFIEFRMRGYDPEEISCLRGKDPRIPLLIIKLYAVALLLRRLHVPHPGELADRHHGEDILPMQYRGLLWVWDESKHTLVHLGTFLSDRDASDPVGAVAYPDDYVDGDGGDESRRLPAYPGCASSVGAVVIRSKIWKPPCEIEAICTRVAQSLSLTAKHGDGRERGASERSTSSIAHPQ